MSTRLIYKSNFEQVIERLMLVSGKTKEFEIAEIIGLKKVAFAARKSRDSLPEKEIKIACVNNGWSFDWVMSGKGEMLEESTRRHTIPRVEEAAEEYWKTITFDGRPLSRQEEKILKMYRYLNENNPELAQHAYEVISEEFMMAAIEKGKG